MLFFNKSDEGNKNFSLLCFFIKPTTSSNLMVPWKILRLRYCTYFCR